MMQIPMILICNDKGSPKMKPFQSTCAMLGFRKWVSPFSACIASKSPTDLARSCTSARPTPAEIRSRIMSICFK